VTAASREDEQPTYDDWQEHAVDPRDRSSDPYRKGDVFWAPDPFKRGTNPDSG